MSDSRPAVAELEIRNLLASVAQQCDFGELDDYLDLFTDDAVWEMPNNPQVGVGASVRTGRASIGEGVRDRRAQGVQGPGTATFHVITTMVVHIESSDQANSSAYWMYFAEADNKPVLRSMGHYQDVVRRTTSGWKVAHRKISVGLGAVAGRRPVP